MKDPAYLFYSQDFYTGVATMNFEDRGKYISILCLMHQQGRMSEETIRFVVGSVSVNLKSKFKVDEKGLWYNERLELEIEKRKNFVESRINNGKLGGRPKDKPKPLGKPKRNRKVNLPENENENEIVSRVYKEGVQVYFDFYNKKVGINPPEFNGGDGKNMKELLNKLVKSMEDKKNDVNETTLINSFKVLLEKLPKFYIENLDIKVINNSYGKIIANIRTKSGAANADSWTDIIAERHRKREEAAKSGQGV